MASECALEGQDLETAQRHHPAFASGDADVELCSRDGVAFHVHSLVLKNTSGWFKKLFSLPQCEGTPSPGIIILPVDETADVLAALLSMACGFEVPKIESLEFANAILHAAEKYDMPGPPSIVRLILGGSSQRLTQTCPLRAYALACKWGWLEEAKLASGHTLSLDLMAPATIEKLDFIDSPDLTRLLLLHRRRRDKLKECVKATIPFYANVSPGTCSNCQGVVIHDRWERMKCDWFAQLECDPAQAMSRDSIESRLRRHGIFEAKCPHCNKELYSQWPTIRNLTAIIDELPQMVEFD